MALFRCGSGSGGKEMEVKYHGAQSSNYSMSFKPQTDTWMVAFLINKSGYQSQFFYHDDTMGNNVVLYQDTYNPRTDTLSNFGFTIDADGTIHKSLAGERQVFVVY